MMEKKEESSSVVTNVNEEKGNKPKVVIKSADMSEEMQKEAIECAIEAIKTNRLEKDIAACLKKRFDKLYRPTWHCIVGSNFGSFVTHETRHFLYFYIDKHAVLLFKSG
eukprot:TRINITY_DN6126_c0_g1_i1.p1 TRINITY_DN6126_c0_g1~~TRINITY_DN6126_c0_g1_i1.p1  ORF type:complete len:109 (-),score=13.73 TRINITY_DN6126_c0_g1_i1:149-475(-)